MGRWKPLARTFSSKLVIVQRPAAMKSIALKMLIALMVIIVTPTWFHLSVSGFTVVPLKVSVTSMHCARKGPFAARDLSLLVAVRGFKGISARMAMKVTRNGEETVRLDSTATKDMSPHVVLFQEVSKKARCVAVMRIAIAKPVIWSINCSAIHQRILLSAGII